MDEARKNNFPKYISDYMQFILFQYYLRIQHQTPDFYQMMHAFSKKKKSLIFLTAIPSLVRPVGVVVVGGSLGDCCHGNVLINDHNAVDPTSLLFRGCGDVIEVI